MLATASLGEVAGLIYSATALIVAVNGSLTVILHRKNKGRFEDARTRLEDVETQLDQHYHRVESEYRANRETAKELLAELRRRRG